VVDYPYFWWAVEPTTGDSFFLELPWRNTNPCQLWGAHFAQTFPQSCNLLVFDHRALHKPKALQWPAHGAPLFLPPESPDLIPLERRWRELQDKWGGLMSCNRNNQMVFARKVFNNSMTATLLFTPLVC
jgi:hypothetical protein